MNLQEFVGVIVVSVLFLAFGVLVYLAVFGPFKNDVCTNTVDSSLEQYVNDAKQGVKTYYETFDIGDCIDKLQLDTQKNPCGCDNDYSDSNKYLCIFIKDQKNPDCYNIGSINLDMTAFGNQVGYGNYRIQVSPQSFKFLYEVEGSTLTTTGS